MGFPDLARVARKQHGVVTRDQAATAITRHQFDRLVAQGHFERMHRGVYRTAGSPSTWRQAAHAAAIAGGSGAVVSFRAAAHLWDLPAFHDAPPVEITVPFGRRARLHEVTVHESQVLDGIHVTKRHGVPVTSAARTLCDLTACCWTGQIARAVDDALRRKITSLRNLDAVFTAIATRGRCRSTIMRELLAERDPDYHAGESDAELRMIRTIVAAGLPRPSQQHRVRTGGRTYRLDGAYPEYRVGLEYEGFDFHITRTAFDERYERDRALRIAGWLLVYVTHQTTPARLVDDVRTALTLRGWPGSPTI